MDTLQMLDAALRRKRAREVRAIWPGISQMYFESAGTTTLTVKEQIQFPQGPDQAVVRCDLVTKAGGMTIPRVVTLTLRNSGGNWTVATAKFD